MLIAFLIGAFVPNPIAKVDDTAHELDLENFKNKVIEDCFGSNVLNVNGYTFYCFTADAPRQNNTSNNRIVQA